jgi:hypothetical protein
MLLDLIEHQEELFTAIIAPLNYHGLSALRISCKTLFAVISSAIRWQHMRNFEASLRQINSIQRAILCDDCGIQTTIIYHNNYYTFYRLGFDVKLEVRRIASKDRYHYVLHDMFISADFIRFYIYDIKDRRKNMPRWLSHCILQNSDGHSETLLDLRC